MLFIINFCQLAANILHIGLGWLCNDEIPRTKDTKCQVEAQIEEQMLLSVANGTNHNFKYVHIHM